jgi:hypothetical protein
VVDVRLLHHVKELAGVGRQRLDVAALPLGVDRVEGEARLARAGQARDDHELVAGDVDVDVLEVVLAGAPHLDELLLGHARLLRTRLHSGNGRGRQSENMNGG